MQVYLVDTENVASTWSALLPVMKRGSKLLLFYTKMSPALSLDTLSRMLERTKNVELIRCHVGDSALDFQLVTELGARITAKPEWEYFILSRDQDYDPVVQYWQERGVSVERLVPETSAHATNMNHKLKALSTETRKAAAAAMKATDAPQAEGQAEPKPKAKKALQPSYVNKSTASKAMKAVRENYRDRIKGLNIEEGHVPPTINAMVKGFRNGPDQDRVALVKKCLPQFVGTKSAPRYALALDPILRQIDENGPIPPEEK